MVPKKLFHAIVVVGATLAGGCGDDRTADAGAVVDAGAIVDAGSTDAGNAIADAAMDAATAPTTRAWKKTPWC